MGKGDTKSRRTVDEVVYWEKLAIDYASYPLAPYSYNSKFRPHVFKNQILLKTFSVYNPVYLIFVFFIQILSEWIISWLNIKEYSE